ncbi:MAG: BppU family phage baseplate upper protein [Enterococcus avium]
MFKTNKEIIVIQAKATTPIPTGVVFWSHDKGTAKMLFQLQKDYVNQTLSEGTIVPICLDFVGGRHIYHAVIEDAINGIVSIVLEDNILGYVGRVTGSIYIELPDSRSLDTAGRFTFDIKRSPIDLNTPELEDYYWQGFNEIIDEYHQTINTIKSEAKALIDSLTADVTTAQSKITQLEQSITTANTNLNARIDEINKKIDDNDIFTKAESSANVIYQLIGKEEAEILITADFKEKITGSVVENPNIIRFLTNSTFMAPLTGSEPGQVYYDGAMTKDGVTLNVGNTNSDYMSQIQLNWNLVEIVDRTIPELFETVGLTDDSEKIEFIKKNVSYIKNTVDGVGTGLRRNRLTFKTYDSAGVLETEESVNDTAKIQELVREYADRATIKNMISDRGFLSALLFTEASDGVAVSQASLDYTKLEFKIKVSANLLIKLMIAANHRENLATQEEAETGEDNKKIMTPLRVMQSIKKFVENKFVSIAGNETIGGIKNFRDGLMVNGNNVLTHKGVVTIKYSNADFPTEIASGYITFVRYGDEVQAVFNFKTRIGNDFAKDQSIIWGIAADFQADTSEPQYIGITSTGGTTSIVKFTAGGSTLTAHSILLKDTWYAGTVTYLAKNKL